MTAVDLLPSARRSLGGLGLLVAVGLPPCAVAADVASATASARAAPAGFDYYVSPFGDDSNRGEDWRRPLRTVQRALDRARPGQGIAIAAGEYYEDIRSVRDGRADAPIRLTGAPGAVLKGAGGSRVIEINHSHLVLSNLEVDGKVSDGKGNDVYRDKLVYIMGRNRSSGVTGVRLLNLRLRNAAGECLRMKYFAHGNEVGYSSVRDCGVRDFRLGKKGKNGEGVYIGTAPEQLERNPTAHADHSNGNWIHHSRFDTRGNECVDIKEGSRHNLIEHNACTGQLDESSGGISLRGNRNIVRFNLIWGNRGAGIRFGGDTARDGIDNEAYGNILRDNAFAAFKIMAQPQARLCGNVVEPVTQRVVRGRFGDQIDPTVPCP